MLGSVRQQSGRGGQEGRDVSGGSEEEGCPDQRLVQQTGRACGRLAVHVTQGLFQEEAGSLDSLLPMRKLFTVINLTAGREEAKSPCVIWESPFFQSAHLTKSDIKSIQSRKPLKLF